MRRIITTLTAAAAVLALSLPAHASTTTLTEPVPRRIAAPIEKACPMDIVATDRLEQVARSTYDDATRTLVTRVISGRQETVFDSSLGTSIAIETTGTTTITRLDDGRYSLVQRNTGFWFDDGSLSGTAEFLRFTGTVRAIGVYDAATFTFQPESRTTSGTTASLCEMLVTGLKTRH
jgi:hypothetical protein